MKNLLLLGDSIRLGYEENVKEMLSGEFDVWGPADNCRFAKYTLCNLKSWLLQYDKKPDVIHWNNGFWDTCIRYAEDGNFTSVDDYIKDMLSIHRELNKICDKIIFATTTPVNPNHNDQNNDTVDKYNARIVPVLEEKGVYINDLNKVLKPHINKYICEDFIHLSEIGKKVCAEAVCSAVRNMI